MLLFKLLTSGPAQENEAEDECQKENIKPWIQSGKLSDFMYSANVTLK